MTMKCVKIVGGWGSTAPVANDFYPFRVILCTAEHSLLVTKLVYAKGGRRMPPKYVFANIMTLYASKPVVRVQDKFCRVRLELERQVEYYKEKLRRTCAKLTEVLALYKEVRMHS